MGALEELAGRLEKKVAEKDELGVRRLAQLYYQQEGAMILPAELQFAAATCFAKNGDYAEAANYYKRFLRFYRERPRASEATWRLGVLYARYLKNPEEARRYLGVVAARTDHPRAAEARHALEKLERPVAVAQGGPSAASSGAWVVLRTDQSAINVSSAGREISAILGRSLVDVTREIKGSRGVLAVGIDRGAAERIVGALAGLKIGARALPETDFAAIPMAEVASRASFSENGYTIHVQESIVAGKYEDLRYIVAAQMRLGRTESTSRRAPGDTMGGYAGVRVFSPGSEERLSRETRVVDFRVIDLFLKQSPRRLRLDERHLELSPDNPRAVNKRLNLRFTGERLAAYARNVTTNQAVGFFLKKGVSSSPWEDFTFDTDRAFDLYCRWLLSGKA
ncbi:MAG: hypothetical protein V2A58_12100 [Planctomycetota bacterium]